MTDTVFQQIIDKTIPADIVHEDEHCLAFHDRQPQAPVHVLVIPKQSMINLADTTPNDDKLLGHLLLTAHQVATSLKVDDGYRLVINHGAKGGQSVFHLHVHLLGGRVMQWPPG